MSVLHVELCECYGYMQSSVDVTVTFSVVWTSLLYV